MDIIYHVQDVFPTLLQLLLLFLLPQINLTESLLHVCDTGDDGSNKRLDCAYNAALYVPRRICW